MFLMIVTVVVLRMQSRRILITIYHVIIIRREITIRHNLVLQVLCRLINYVGGVAAREPIDLHDKDGRRPDLELLLRSLHALLDVMIVNPLCPTHLIASSKESLASVRGGERKKTNKYKGTASQHEAKFI